MKKLLSLLVLFQLLHGYADWTLVENGKSDYVIVIPANASKYEQFSSNELADHLEQISGVKLEIVSEDNLKSGQKFIAVGNTSAAGAIGVDQSALGDEEIIIRTDENGNLILSGGRIRGSMFAVYDFLEKQLGCHWFDEFTFEIPARKVISIPPLNLAYRPYFMFRRSSANIMVDTELWEKFILRNQGCDGPYLAGYDAIGAPVACHSFEEYAKRFPAGDTDFYAMDEKGRRLKPNGSSGPDFCLSNPKVIANVTESLKTFIRKDRERYQKIGFPPPFIYDVSQNDGSLMFFCLCPECKKITEKYQAPSGLLLHFINQISENIRSEYPEIYVQTFAYNQGLKVPVGIVPGDRVLIRFCTTTDIYGVPFDAPENSQLQKELESWSKISDSMGIWLYTYFFKDTYPMPYVSADQFGPDFRYLARNKVKTVYVENHDYYKLSFFALQRWLAYQLMQNPNQDADALIDTFFQGYYGGASAVMKEYYDYLLSFQKTLDKSVFSKEAEVPRAYLTGDFFRKADEILERAELLCRPGTRDLLNVHRERAIVDSAYLHLEVQMAEKVLDAGKVLDRYEKYRMELLDTVVPEEKKNSVLPKIKNDIDFFKRSDELVAAMKKEPNQMLIPLVVDQDWSKARVIDSWSENMGLATDKKISAKLMHDNVNLKIRLEERGIGRPLLDGPGEVWSGDDWELHFTEDCADGDLRMIAVGPRKGSRILEVGRRPGGMPNGESVNLETFASRVDSKIENDVWTVELEIPLKNLTPEGNVKPGGVMYMNMFRGAAHLGEAQAWNPTFDASFHIPWRLGKTWIGK